MRRERSFGLALISGLLVAGCGWFGGPGPSGSEPPRPPEGFRRASTAVVAFAYPNGWRTAPEGAYGEGWTAAYEGREGGESVAQVAVFEKLPDTSDPFLAAEAAITGVEQNAENMRRRRQREVSVPGATGAVRIDYTYAAVVQGERTGETVQGTDVTVVDDAGRAATVRITRVRGKVADRVVEQIVASIAMQPPSR